MQRISRFVIGMAVLFAVLLLASAGQAKQHSKPGIAKPSAVAAGRGSIEVDEECLARYDRRIEKCGKNQKCVTKYKKLKQRCPSVYHPDKHPHVMQQQPPQHVETMRPMMQDNQRSMDMREMRSVEKESESVILQRTAPQPTGKATGVKSLPDANYTPPPSWMKWW